MTTSDIHLRPAQAQILAYKGGQMAISAVPGSGKTFTLTQLACQLISQQGTDQLPLDITTGQQILIVTYLNASVDTFKARIRQQLTAADLPTQGYDVRTLHSLALEIMRLAHSSLENPDGPQLIDEIAAQYTLEQAVDGWIATHTTTWLNFLDNDTPKRRTDWRRITINIANTFIRTAKNERLTPTAIAAQLEQTQASQNNYPLLPMLTGIYDRYQRALLQQTAVDFNDLIWQAVDLLGHRPDLAQQLRQRWPIILEDEAQDSVPLQEQLLTLLAGTNGNLIRVGDPNQAITSSFTAAHPRYFNQFNDNDQVISRPLPNSGRSAPLIMGAANALLDWVCDHHPVPEVRQHAFRRQHILPAPEGDSQPNPPDSEANMRLQVYRHREQEELPDTVRLAHAYTQKYPDRTVAILVPTHNLGHDIADILDDRHLDYDNLLRGGGRAREIATALHALLELLANPTNTRHLVTLHQTLYALDHPAARLPLIPTPEGEAQVDDKQFYALLNSLYQPERFLYPDDPDSDPFAAFPANIVQPHHHQPLHQFATFLQRIFALRPLPIDDLTLTLGDELFAHTDTPREADIAIAYQIAFTLRRWQEMYPDWRLPQLAAELQAAADGRVRLHVSAPADTGFEPAPGRITLATQHGAKGLEWDAVFLLGIDSYWIPNHLDSQFQGAYDFLGGDPQAEAIAQLHHLIGGDAQLYPQLSATDSAHVDVICERLRLLYVGITRARRFLQISRSRTIRRGQSTQEAHAANALGALHEYLHPS